ncbi:ABC transporter ATP-binding protein [uncultured Desulfosarcina sp.]|uniref:ABC transporter ATP-binding protein n=1 Tax=uncultured Desulfosarcina sp. TaxID=218289 RepID=UPI0029C7B1D8|nr:ABC transporter ATP-binding protein [uncultured Desulfosarcina sp.]
MISNDIAIKADNLSKIYRIGEMESRHDSLGQAMFAFLKSPLKNFQKYRSLYRFDDIDKLPENETANIIWALKNLSFEVKKGEALGIIGKNGAGKSTLLKILSRITDPTHGRVEIHGRNSSLLEVGTGFHPELTGRENVYLNGTVLGMRKGEIKQKFDEIVEFSGVGKFIDTPVKRYSSGMSVRLAFAVAAHLEPEILIVDEVLAVGDAEFQMKCIGKMNSVTRGGRTVLFVSHNMGAITELCSRVLWIADGGLKADGAALDVVSEYLSSNPQQGESFWEGKPEAMAQSGKQAWLRCARVITDNGGEPSSLVGYDENAKIEIEYEIKQTARAFRSYIMLRDATGNLIWSSHDTDETGGVGRTREPGVYCSTCVFPKSVLRPGQYYVSIGIYGKPTEYFEEEHVDAVHFQISEAGYKFTRDKRKGLLTPNLPWEITCL